MNARILIMRSRTEGNAPRWMAWRSMMPKPDLDQVQPGSRGRGEVDMDPGVRRQPGLYLGMLVGGVVVHDQVQLLVGVAAGNVAQEDQELLVSVPRLAQAGDLWASPRNVEDFS